MELIKALNICKFKKTFIFYSQSTNMDMKFYLQFDYTHTIIKKYEHNIYKDLYNNTKIKHVYILILFTKIARTHTQ